MDGLSVEQGSSGMQLSHSTAASQQSSLSSSTPKSPVLVAAKRLAFELDHLSEVRTAIMWLAMFVGASRSGYCS